MAKHYIVAAAVAYLFGSIPFGYILVRLFMKQDIRQTGSGNIGATNVARSGKKGLAIATLLLDALKGSIAVMYASSLLMEVTPRTVPKLMAVAALFAILGHCFPIWLKFRGGKGVATGVGAFAMLAPRAVLIALAVFALVFAISRFVSLSSILAAAVFPAAAYWIYPEYRSLTVSLSIAFASCLIIAKHYTNIRRLIDGTENKFGGKPKGPIDVERSL